MLFIGAANGAGVYAVLHYVPQFKGLVSNWVGPCVVATLQGVIIGQMFMSVYSFASDTMLQAFMVDEELDRPDGMRPAVMQQFIEAVESNGPGKDNMVKPVTEAEE